MVSNAATKLIDEARRARGGRVVPLRRSLCLELCWVRFLGEEGRVVEERGDPCLGHSKIDLV
jgi:hypothetical protein